jgi:hypothetical protein|tara:strand:- start:29984 stop:30172 length:189 start_codon:yes stop_codon:yes gene_type:complete
MVNYIRQGGIFMPYDVYLDKKMIFESISKEQAEEIRTTMQRMIMAGINTTYKVEDIRIEPCE